MTTNSDKKNAASKSIEVGPPVLVLPVEAFKTAYNWTGLAEGNVEAVAYAAFNHPSSGVIDAYAKFYHPSTRGLVNEVTGYILGRACGLPVPPLAFVALVPLDELPQPLVGVTKHAAALRQRWFPAFCTQDASSTSVQPIADTASLREELIRWSAVHACVAFDEHAANADRHLKNLVRRGLRDYVLIDHGRLAWRQEAPEWAANTLEPLGEYDNRLSHILWDHKPGNDVASAILKVGAEHCDRLLGVAQELRGWWQLLVADQNDQTAWELFLTERLAHVEYLLRRRYRMLA